LQNTTELINIELSPQNPQCMNSESLLPRQLLLIIAGICPLLPRHRCALEENLNSAYSVLKCLCYG